MGQNRLVNTRLLTIEDDDDVRLTLRMVLEDEGYDVAEAANAEEGLARFAEVKPSLVLVDLKLPDRSGFDVCRAIRQTSDVPIIIVTAQESSFDVVAGLEAGADDYVTKPFVPKELAARIRAHLRRATTGTPSRSEGANKATGPETPVKFGSIEVFRTRGVVMRGGEEIHLTKTEFRLLEHFLVHAEVMYSREQLLEQVWGHDYLADTRLVDAHIRRLRTKVEDDAANPRHIVTVRGMGYRFVP